MSRCAVVVASVPGGHPYVRHLDPSDGPSTVRRLPDPDPDHPEREARGRWWPAAMLRADWVERADVDLMHVHFGFDHCSPDDLRALTRMLRRRGLPLVVTVHDLRSPHQADPGILAAQLDVLLGAADHVLTLTPWAAREIGRRFGVAAEVTPHPHVVDLAVMERVRRERRGGRRPAGGARRVGVAAKGLRANTDVAGLLPALAEATADVDARLVVTLHREVLDRDDARSRTVVRDLRRAERAGRVELVVHEPWDDATLWAHVAGLDAAVLPYRFGTHSGWLEMSHDLGTPVVAPALGGYADQGADALVPEQPDAAALAGALARVLDRPDLAGAEAEQRRQQRDRIARRHAEVYATLLARRVGAA